MPPLDSTVQEQGFRSALFGFDKDDVLAYVSALAAENQQQAQLHEEQCGQLQAQLDKLKAEQANARACVEKLQQQLAEAEDRAALAEKQYDEIAAKLADAEKRAADASARSRENQQAANEWQFKCRDLQRQLDAAAAEKPVMPVVPAASVNTDSPAEARLEARRILADARITAENAEKRLAEQADEQKRRMAENARGIAAGVMVLRDRLARVDARLDAASLDLENATAAIYEALSQTEADLRALGVEMSDFRRAPDAPPKPAAPAPVPAPAPASAAPEPPARQKATAQAVQRPASSRKAPVRGVLRAKPQRLRQPGRVAVSQELLDALERLDDQ